MSGVRRVLGWVREALRLEIAIYAAYRVRPDVLAHETLALRGGLRSRIDVPLDAIASTRTEEYELPGLVKAVHLEDDLLLLGVSSRTNLELVLTGPTELATSNGPVTAARVGMWVDEPREVAKRVRDVAPRLA